jgi:2-(1,2-epoxy-1,2-dihydrophenyl)acetyl-CoA isomerase
MSTLDEVLADDGLLFEVSEGVATFTLNKPKNKNAISSTMFLNMERHLIEVANNKDIRVVLIKGAEKTFSAGADLAPESRELKKITKNVAFDGDTGGDILDRANRCILKLRELPKPVICQIEGSAVGIGFSLALAADIRFASSNSRMGVVFSKIGLGPDGGASYFLTHLVGSALALELLYLGELIAAPEALQMGLINRVIETDSLEEEVSKLAIRLSEGPTLSYAASKEAVYASTNSSLESILDLEARNQNAVGRSKDSKEGIKAFFEKRKANFTGR